MIFGNIRKFITEDALNQYDRLLSRGHFSLYRNNPEVNRVYKLAGGGLFRDVFSSNRGWSFDEWGKYGVSNYWKSNYDAKFYDEILFDDIIPLEYPFYSSQKKNSDKNKKNFIYSYENGNLYRIYEHQGKIERQEILYVHFQKRPFKVCTEANRMFTIVPNKFVDFIPDPNTQFLSRQSPATLFYKQYYKIKLQSLKRHLLHII